MAKRGAPIQYEDSVFCAILERYAGGTNLLDILAEKGMPTWGAFWKRVMGPNAAPELVSAHARARDSWAEAKVEEAMHISDTPLMGKKTRKGPKGKIESVTHGDAVDARRLKVSTRLWFAERVLAKSYAGRTALQNPDGSNLNVVPVINLTVTAEGAK